MEYTDPCTIGPLSCGPVDCQQLDDDDDAMTLFTAASQSTRVSRFSNRRKSGNILSSLEERVVDFQAKGWLSQQEHNKYMALLKTAPKPKENAQFKTEPVLQELSNELDALEEKMHGTSIFGKHLRLSALTPRSGRENQSEDRPKAFGFLPASKVAKPVVPLGARTNKLNNRNFFSVVAPKDLAKELSEDHISELFVETCFFARLGFVQPPCCLQCTYRESMKETVPNINCNRWVVWRRDAKHILHPTHLCDNAIAVQCHAARKLLAGKVVDNHHWDSINKVLLPRNGKPFKHTCM